MSGIWLPAWRSDFNKGSLDNCRALDDIIRRNRQLELKGSDESEQQNKAFILE